VCLRASGGGHAFGVLFRGGEEKKIRLGLLGLKAGKIVQGEIVTRQKASASSQKPPAQAKTLRATASTWEGPRSDQPSRSAPRKVATTSRSSPTIAPSTPRSCESRGLQYVPCGVS
jgi:hypothetical protein